MRSPSFRRYWSDEFDLSKMTPLKPGSVIIMPANTPHYGWAKEGEVVIQEVGIGPTAIDMLH